MVGSVVNWPKKLSELNSQFTDSYVTTSSAHFHNVQSDIDTNAAAFETQNGDTIVLYYNPFCIADLNETEWHYSHPKMCANFIYDLNGNKGPNSVGKDIGFITALYSSEPSVVAPIPLPTNAASGTTVKQANASAACTAQDADSRIPNIEELSAMYYNKNIIGMPPWDFWSSSVVSYNRAMAWDLHFGAGRWNPRTKTTGLFVRCVKR